MQYYVALVISTLSQGPRRHVLKRLIQFGSTPWRLCVDDERSNL